VALAGGYDGGVMPSCEKNGSPQSIVGLTGFKLVRRLGAGRRCTVWQAQRGAEQVALKFFTSRAIAKHAMRHDEPLARFELNRNQRLYAAPALRKNIVRPIGAIDRGGQQILMQDVVRGETLSEFSATAHERDRHRIYRQLVRIVTAAHNASIFDLDIHSGNILITRGRTGEPNVMLFDFNKIPFHEWPPNAVVRCLVRLGWLGPASRDLRLLRTLRKTL